MPNKDAPGELASARLEIPVRNKRRARPGQVRLIEASIQADRHGAMTVTMRTEPPTGTITLPLLACLQFVARFEEAVADALTNVASGSIARR